MNHAQKRARERKLARLARPHVRLNMAMSLDGHIMAGKGGWQTTSSEDHRRMDKLREWADCVVITRSTLLSDNPNLFIRRKPESPRHPVPVIVFRDSNRGFSNDLRLFKKPHPEPLFCVTRYGNPQRGSDVTGYGNPQQSSSSDHYGIPQRYQKNLHFLNSLTEIPQKLHSLGFQKVLIEGGPTLGGALIHAGLIDELFITLTPFILGGDNKDRLVYAPLQVDALKFRLIAAERRKDEMFLRYIKIANRSNGSKE
ncbi:MAG: RibD family protein [Leptospiraceae bacterium]|nr:RibD family protein [Leptospiraceae bacterium]